MTNDQFAKLFEYVTGRFDLAEKQLEAKADKQDLDRIINGIDTILAKLEVLEDEQLILGRLAEVHGSWIRGLANKADYKLQS